MRTTSRPAIYARISDDKADGAGVARQLKACRDVAGPDALEYVDNSVSAFSGKRRPAFERLIQDVQSGLISEVHCWATDRLYRRLSDLERLVDLLGDTPVLAVKSGRVDLSTADGRLNARLLGSVAQHSSEKSGERIAASRKDARESGRYATAVRPMGWDKVGGQWVIVEDEAQHVRQAYADVLNGTSLRVIAQRWRDAGLIGTRGGKITSAQVRSALLTGRQAGVVTYKGEPTSHDIADGLALVDKETWLRVRAVLLDPKRTANPGRPNNALLSGIARCGKCGGKMYGANILSSDSKRRPLYFCQDGNRHLSRNMEAVDGPILALVARRLGAQLDQINAGTEVPHELPQTSTSVAELEERLDEATELARLGMMGMADFAAISQALRADIEAARVDLVPTAEESALAELSGEDDIAAAIRRLQVEDVDKARAVIRELFAEIVILPVGRGRHGGPDSIRYVWR